MPKVDVVITTYRRPLNIVIRAVESVIKQTENNINILVIDDSGKEYDNSPLALFVEKLKDERVKYYKLQENRGACYARNYGASVASSPFIAFLDDDDEWMADKLEKQLKIIEKSDTTGIVFSGLMRYYDSNNKTTIAKIKNCNPAIEDLLRNGNVIGTTSSALLRREAYEKSGKFDVEMPSLQDYDLWTRILLAGYKAIGIDQPLVRYHISNFDRISSNTLKKLNGWERMYQKNNVNISKDTRSKGMFCRELSFYNFCEKKYKKSIKYLLTAIIKDPLNIYNNCKTIYKIMFKRYSQI